MTHQENIQKIREACIKANPEIVELTFGCEVAFRFGADAERGLYIESVNAFEDPPTMDLKDGITVLWNWQGYGYDPEQHNIPHGEYEIIGRPIRLADVLLAFLTDKNVDWEGVADEQVRIVSYWNLRKDSLEAQSEETVAFIASLLTKE